jgi:multidrug efflux pump subunit AcrB
MNPVFEGKLRCILPRLLVGIAAYLRLSVRQYPDITR